MISLDHDASKEPKGADESALVMDSSVPLIHHNPDKYWITDTDPDHSKGTHPQIFPFDFAESEKQI